MSKSVRYSTLGLAALMMLSSASDIDAQRRGKKQREVAAQGQFQDTTSVTVVEVPVTVTSKGSALRGLTRENFEIIDGKQRQELIGFEIVDLEQNDATEMNVPVAARRHFLAFFDLSFSDPNSIKQAQEAAADVVLSHLHPSDLAAVATYSKSKGPNLVLPFTTDRNQVRFAIETLGMVATERTQRDPLGLLVKDIGVSSDVADEGGDGPGGGGFAAELQAQLGELAALQSRSNQAEAVTTVAESMDGLAAMAGMLGAVEGRKHVLYLSEGFDGEILFGTENIARQQAMARAVEEGRTQDVNNDDRFGNSDARRVVDRTLEALRRADASIQAIDIGGLVAGGKNRNLESLSYMARETNGEAFSNFNNLGDAMGQLLEKTSVTYLLSFSPRGLANDGEFHELTVKTKGVPRGTDVAHRPGYFAPKPWAQRSGFERNLKVAQDVVGGQRGTGGATVNVIAAGFPVAGQNSYVPVLVEISGKDMMRDFTEDVIPVEIFAYAMDNEGTVKDFFVRQLALNRAQAGAALENTGLKYWGHFDVDPGEYTVRVVARNPATGISGIDVDTIVVPDSSASMASVAVLFPEPQGKWVFLREEATEQRAVDYPFIADNNPYIPASLPQVSGATPVNIVANGLGSGSLSAEAQVLTAGGETVNGGKFSLSGKAEAGSGTSTLAAEFDSKGIDAGEYLLVVTIKNLASGKEARSTVPVQIL